MFLTYYYFIITLLCLEIKEKRYNIKNTYGRYNMALSISQIQDLAIRLGGLSPASQDRLKKYLLKNRERNLKEESFGFKPLTLKSKKKKD